MAFSSNRNGIIWILLSIILTLLPSVLSQINISGDLRMRQSETAVFTATITGFPGLDATHIAWVVKGIRLIQVGEASPKYSVEFNRQTGTSTLTIQNVNLSDDGYYRCQVTAPSGQGQNSPKARLTVLVPPTKVSMVGGETQIVTESTDYNITCVAEGSNPAVTFLWLKSGAAATETAISSSSGAEGSSLVTTNGVITVNLKKADLGSVYTCKATGDMMMSADGMSASTTITVQYAPKVTMTPSGADLSLTQAKSDATFTCAADANPSAVTWKWMLNDVDIAGADTSTYKFPKIGRDENGKTLKCVASNAIGSTAVSQLLNVHYGPVFTKTQANTEADVGETKTLSCDVDGNPTPTIIWMRQGSSRILTSAKDLTLTNLNDDDFGAYVCIGTVASFENAQFTTHLLKKDVPKMEQRTEFKFSQGQTGLLTCEAACVPSADQVIWRAQKTGKIVDTSPSSRFSVAEERTIFGLKSHLTIRDLATDDFTQYNCTISNAKGSNSTVITLTQIDDFPWMFVLIGIGGAVFLGILIAVTVCCCRRNQKKTSSAGSLSVVSHTTDSSTKKTGDALEHLESSSLPEYFVKPMDNVDTWRNASQTHQHSHHMGYDTLDYPKPELYGSYRAVNTAPPPTYSAVQYASYRPPNRQRGGALPALHYAPQYSTLPMRPSMLPPDDFHRPMINPNPEFPEPPPEARLATNV